MMDAKVARKNVLAAVVMGSALLGGSLAASGEESRLGYQSSIKVGAGTEGESGEAAALVSQAKIDAARAMSAALAEVQGTVLKVSLDNENGNLVYSVEVKTASNEVKDVKVDAGNAKVLTVDTGDDDVGEKGEGEGEQENR